MKKIGSFIFTLITFCATAQTPADIFTAFYDATGGKEKWDNVSTYTLTRSFVANDPTDYEMEDNVSVASGSISRRKSIMKRDFFYVVKGNDGWLKIPMGSMDKNVKYTVKDLSDKEKKSLQEELNNGILSFINYDKKGFTASVEGTENVNGKPTDKVVLKKEGITITYFFDKSSHLLVKEIYTTPEQTETWEHTAYNNTANGLKYASTSTYINTKDKKKTNVTTKLVVNETLPPTLFVRE